MYLFNFDKLEAFLGITCHNGQRDGILDRVSDEVESESYDRIDKTAIQSVYSPHPV